MEGFLQVDTSLVISVVRVMFLDKLRLVRGIEREGKRGSLPVSKWKTLVAKSGQDGRNDTNRARSAGFGPRPENRDKIDSVYVWEFVAGEF